MKLVAVLAAAASCTASAAAATTQAHAASAAQVPCKPHPGKAFDWGKVFDCQWYPPGDGLSGGALVVAGEQIVGHLHQGTNWVVCQQRGAEVSNAAGDRNHWYAWTQADYNPKWEAPKWGWASPLDARGGDNDGSFAGVPDCKNAHGGAPTTGGLWGGERQAAAPTPPASPPSVLPPAPPTPPASPPASAPSTRQPQGQGKCDSPRVSNRRIPYLLIPTVCAVTSQGAGSAGRVLTVKAPSYVRVWDNSWATVTACRVTVTITQRGEAARKRNFTCPDSFDDDSDGGVTNRFSDEAAWSVQSGTLIHLTSVVAIDVRRRGTVDSRPAELTMRIR